MKTFSTLIAFLGGACCAILSFILFMPIHWTVAVTGMTALGLIGGLWFYIVAEINIQDQDSLDLNKDLERKES